MKFPTGTIDSAQVYYDFQAEEDRICDTCYETCCKDCEKMPDRAARCNCPECEDYSDNVDPGYDGILGEG
jgi:hypothetical protein